MQHLLMSMSNAHSNWPKSSLMSRTKYTNYEKLRLKMWFDCVLWSHWNSNANDRFCSEIAHIFPIRLNIRSTVILRGNFNGMCYFRAFFTLIDFSREVESFCWHNFVVICATNIWFNWYSSSLLLTLDFGVNVHGVETERTLKRINEPEFLYQTYDKPDFVSVQIHMSSMVCCYSKCLYFDVYRLFACILFDN